MRSVECITYIVINFEKERTSNPDQDHRQERKSKNGNQIGYFFMHIKRLMYSQNAENAVSDTLDFQN